MEWLNSVVVAGEQPLCMESISDVSDNLKLIEHLVLDIVSPVDEAIVNNEQKALDRITSLLGEFFTKNLDFDLEIYLFRNSDVIITDDRLLSILRAILYAAIHSSQKTLYVGKMMELRQDCQAVLMEIITEFKASIEAQSEVSVLTVSSNHFSSLFY